MAIYELFSKILLIQIYHTTCVSFSCEFNTIFTLNGNEEDIVSDFKYLGVLFTQNGRFVQNTKNNYQISLVTMHLV